MKKQILFTFTILILAVCLIGAVSAEAVDENVSSISENTINDTTTTIAETEKSTPDVTITGEVQKCSDGTPFPGVTVTATSSGETISTTTNAAGTYLLYFKSSSTNFQVTASAPGHQPSTQEVTVLPGEDNVYHGTANFKLGMDTVYVATTGNDVTGDGTQANPYRTIGKGITEANPDGTVNVADGTYQEHLTINKNVNLVGTSQTGTIIDGNNNGRPITIANGVTVSITLFTIQNGRVTGYDAYGGGIANSGNLTLNNCTVKNNKANPIGFFGSSYGGGIYNSGNMTINGSKVENNTGTGYYAYGGGIHNWGTMTIEDSIIQNNSASSWSDEALGGGIYNEDTLTIINSNINGNRAQSSYPDDAYGGGIYNRGALIMDNTSMEGNVASGYDAYGGGIYSYYGTMEIKNSDIHNNLAEASNTSAYGGGIYLNSGSLTLTNSNSNHNTVTGQDGFGAEGGGIYNSGGTMTITGGSVSSNRVNGYDARGGGISISYGYHNVVVIDGCTIQANAIYSTSTSNGGGIYYHTGPGYNTATLNITDSIIKGNNATNGGGIYNYQSSLTITGSTVQENNAAIGAGIWNSGPTSISDSTITGNIASIQGGGIHHWSGTLTLTDTNITHNTATSYGGGISNDGTLYIQNSAINDNTAQFGGGIYNIDREVVLDNTEILRNTATDYNGNGARGGAIYNHYGAVTIDKSKINNNTAYSYTFVYGGGIYTYGGSLTITNSNFNHNTAAATSNVYGGGIYTYDSVVTMNFNRIVGNSPKAIYHSLDSQYGTVNAEYNWWGSNNPDFATLISGVVDYNLRLYMTFQADPTTIQQGSTSTLTANFNNAFDGETVIPLNPADGHLPDGILVTFTTDLGQVGSQTVDKPTVDGVAFATLTGTESGVANVSAMLDDETLTSTVDIQSHSQSELYIETSSSNNNPIVGDVITVTFKLGNRGPDTAENVVMAYVIPEGLEFVTANDDTGNTWTYDENTRTLTWNVGSVPKGDPNLWLTLRVVRAGQYLINPALTTSTYDPTLNSNIQSITINAAAGSDPDNKNNTTVNAATITETVGMQETGTPLTGIVLAILMVLGGLIATRKN